MVRVLCLHGHRQTAEIFENQISKLRLALAPLVEEWVFLDAPYELPRSHVDDDVCTRSWSATPTGDGNDETDIDALYSRADAMVDAAMSTSHFDLLFGFSQGALVLYRFLMRHWDASTDTLAPPYHSLKGFMVAGAPDPRRAFAEDSTLLASFTASQAGSEGNFFGHHLPSLHMVGKKDAIVSPAESEAFTAACGARAELLHHDHAHCVPQLQASLRAIKAFVEGCTQSEDPDVVEATLEARQSELEMLAAMYEDSVRRADHPAGATVNLPLFTNVEDRIGDANVAAALARLQVQFNVPRRYPAVKPDVMLVGGTSAHSVGLERWRADLLARTAAFVDEDMASGTAMLLPIHMFMNEQAEAALSALQGFFTAADGDEGPHHGAEKETNGRSAKDLWEAEDDETRATLIEASEQKAVTMLAAWRQQQRGGLGGDGSHVTTGDESDHSAATGKQSGGSWTVTIGLIGKPSAGKSTLFNAITDPDSESAAARVAAFPFTTIEPNIGTAFGGLCCPCKHLCPAPEAAASSSSVPSQLKLGRDTCDAEYGHVRARGHEHYRRHPIRVKDVAGLVQGAYQGKGKGNQFLNDLCDADVLVHVVDGAAATEADGTACAPGQGSTLEDIGWVRAEVHSWIYDNIKAKWQTIFRLPNKFLTMFSGYRSSPAFVERVLRRVGIQNEAELALRVREWGPYELHLFIALYVHLRFPMVVALNKADLPTAEALVAQLHARYPHEVLVPMTAMTEWNLLCLRKKGYVQYLSGASSMSLTASGEALQSYAQALMSTRAAATSSAGAKSSSSSSSKEKADPRVGEYKQLAQAQSFFVAQSRRTLPSDATHAVSPSLPLLDDSTGVQNVVATALEACAVVQVVPVSAFQPSVPSLQHCFTFKPGTTAEDVFWAMTYAKLLDGKLVRFEAVDVTHPLTTAADVAPMILKREATMPSCAVLVRILSNKRQMN